MKENSIGERIIYLCEEKDITLYQLAVNAMMPMTTLNNITRGRTANPGIYTVDKICEGLGITLFDFLDFEEFRKGENDGKDSK